MFVDRQALEMAVNALGCEVVNTNVYKWWGRSVVDYPLPAGMRQEDLGKNAEFVIRLTEETKKRLGRSDPYEVGVMADPNNPGCYVAMYDHFLGGYGVDDALGSPVHHADGSLTILPKLMQEYAKFCDALAARESGDQIEFLTAKQAYEKYPGAFPVSKDESTWVSIAHTESRTGVR